MAQQWFVAQDTFNAELPGGGQVTIHKGGTFPSGHHAVKLDAGRGILFRPQDEGADEEPAPRRIGRSRKSAADGDGGTAGGAE